MAAFRQQTGTVGSKVLAVEPTDSRGLELGRHIRSSPDWNRCRSRGLAYRARCSCSMAHSA
jgi:hypothetical protein